MHVLCMLCSSISIDIYYNLSAVGGHRRSAAAMAVTMAVACLCLFFLHLPLLCIKLFAIFKICTFEKIYNL